jgi:crotonobetainyl-CoA:carnitine CoA-transferase CaiB-like acyl-CoA transferase
VHDTEVGAGSPLQGLRVLDLSRVLAGPFAGRMLADLGADVVKVEPPAGDVTRLWGARRNGISGYFNQQNAGKRGICVDLTMPAGVELIGALAKRADILIENFRPDVMGRFGLSYHALREINPRLIMLSISGFGSDGPESRRAAYAPIIHAESGLMARQAENSGSRPADMALSVADTTAGLHGLVAVLAALHLRERSGAGQHIDVAMIDAILATDDHMHCALDDSYDIKNMPSEVWDSSAGPIVIAGDFRHLWRQLSTVLGVEDPTPADADLEEKIAARRAATRRFLTSTCADRPAVIAAMDEMNLAWGDVRTTFAALDLPTVSHRRTITEVDDRGGGTRRLPQSPYRFSAAESRVRGGAPHQGEHNAVVLRDWLGPDAGRLERWRDALVMPAGEDG